MVSVPATTTSMIPATLSVAVGSATDVGGRSSNEDAIVAIPLPDGAAQHARAAGEPAFLLAVADGMGGPEGGEIASALAVQALRETALASGGADPALMLKQAFRKANEAIWQQGGANGADPMGTTLTAALVQGKFVAIASLGDSRAYLLRGSGITQVTKDHSLVAEQIASGRLRPADARTHPQRNVLTQALGLKPKLDKDFPPVYELSLLPDDRLLLCTDGFYDVVSDADLAAALSGIEAVDAASSLVALAKERGTTDNVSAVVAQAVPTRIPTPISAPAAHKGGVSGMLIAAIVVVVLVAVIAALFLLGVVGS
ncbi:MAG: PP2C family protein-serine/threonine phosphatase [Thermomicrobiales bacterium]